MLDTLDYKTITLDSTSNVFYDRKYLEVTINSSKTVLKNVPQEGLDELLSICLNVKKDLVL